MDKPDLTKQLSTKSIKPLPKPDVYVPFDVKQRAQRNKKILRALVVLYAAAILYLNIPERLMLPVDPEWPILGTMTARTALMVAAVIASVALSGFLPAVLRMLGMVLIWPPVFLPIIVYAFLSWVLPSEQLYLGLSLRSAITPTASFLAFVAGILCCD